MQAILKTRTIINYNQIDGTVEIKVVYEDGELPNTLLGAIAQIVRQYQSVSYKEGDLILFVKNSPSQINYQLDTNGNLILFTSTNDASKYSLIPETGELEYEKDI